MVRMSSTQERKIVEAYEAWDPTRSSADELASSLSVSKQTLYDVVRRNGVELKSTRRSTVTGGEVLPDALVDRMAHSALRVLLDEVVSLRARVRELEERDDQP